MKVFISLLVVTELEEPRMEAIALDPSDIVFVQSSAKTFYSLQGLGFCELGLKNGWHFYVQGTLDGIRNKIKDALQNEVKFL